MNTRGLMGLVAISVGRELGLLNAELFTMFVLMALVTTLMTTPLLRLWLPPELRVSCSPAAVGGRARPKTRCGGDLRAGTQSDVRVQDPKRTEMRAAPPVVISANRLSTESDSWSGHGTPR
jgi:hypothetical protein